MKYLFIIFIFLFLASCQGRNTHTDSQASTFGGNDTILIATDDATAVNQVDAGEATVHEVSVDEMTADEVVTAEPVDIPGFGLPTITINPDRQTAGQLTLNDITKSIEYIPLETNEKCLIGTVGDVILSENYMLIRCAQTSLMYLFKRTGEFVSKIGNVGQGPNEYPHREGQPVYIDEQNDQVIIFSTTNSKLLYYSANGSFLKSSSMKVHETRVEISFYNDFIVRKIPNNGTTTQFSYEILNHDGETVSQHIRPVQYRARSTSIGPGLSSFSEYVYNDQMHIRATILNDTVYAINNDFAFIPKYIINSTRDKTVDMLSVGNTSNIHETVYYQSLFETRDYILIHYATVENLMIQSHFCYYQKKDNRLMHFPKSSIVIPNDYDGGLHFWPLYQYNDQLFAFRDAYRFIENENKLKPQGPADAVERLNQLSRTMDPEDNPVMVVVTLK